MPVLFTLHLFGWDVALPTYGLLLAAAFLLALAVAVRQARRAGIDSAAITDLWIISLISGVVGAKVLLWLLEYDRYLANPREILATLRSAGVFYGGLILAIGVSLIFIRRRGLDGWLIGDILAPAIALGQTVGRWGCFAAGCCYGKPAPPGLPWPVTFTDGRAAEVTGVPLNVPLHPAQLYLSLANFVLFLVLVAVAARKKFTGQVLLLYLILYAVLRGTLEIFRGDPRGELLGLSTSQWLSIVVGAAALLLYVMRARRAGRTDLSEKSPKGAGRRRKEAPAR